MRSTSPRSFTLARAALLVALAACAGAVALRPQAAAQEVSSGPVPSLDGDRLRTDLEVMRRVLDRQAVQRSGGAGQDAAFTAYRMLAGAATDSASAAYYVAGDGAVFLLRTSLVVTPPKQEPAVPQEKEPTLWDEVRAEVEGRPPAVQRAPEAAPAYSAAYADALLSRILDTLREYGARVEQLPRDEHMTVIVNGAPHTLRVSVPAVEPERDAHSAGYLLTKAWRRSLDTTRQPGSVMTVRVSRADVLAAASGSLSAEDFRRRAVVFRY